MCQLQARNQTRDRLDRLDSNGDALHAQIPHEAPLPPVPEAVERHRAGAAQQKALGGLDKNEAIGGDGRFVATAVD